MNQELYSKAEQINGKIKFYEKIIGSFESLGFVKTFYRDSSGSPWLVAELFKLNDEDELFKVAILEFAKNRLTILRKEFEEL